MFVTIGRSIRTSHLTHRISLLITKMSEKRLSAEKRSSGQATERRPSGLELQGRGGGAIGGSSKAITLGETQASSSICLTQPANKPWRKEVEEWITDEIDLTAVVESKPSKTGIFLSFLAVVLFCFGGFLGGYWHKLYSVRRWTTHPMPLVLSLTPLVPFSGDKSRGHPFTFSRHIAVQY